MSHPLRSITVAIALVGGAGFALAAGDQMPGTPSSTPMPSEMTSQASGVMSKGGAQAQLNLTSAQQQTIAKELAAEEPANASFQPTLGAKVPASIALKPVPIAVANDMPSVRLYSYAKLRDDAIVLVDPKSRTVAAVIAAGASTSGSAPSERSDTMQQRKN